MNKFEYNQMTKDAITGKLDNYPEQLNNVGSGVQVEAEQIPATDFKPRMI